ncbi:MAG TPA: phage holin family protein [Bacteroidetes bacterium]|nr:phage holin family protein [Bacteroidota bacterium]HIL56719.1 phage holin family protein [Rhodothermales bacterium]
MKLLLRWVASALALLLVAYLLTGIEIASWQTAFIAALVLGLVNATIGTVVKFITTPIRWLTLGLFSLVINAVLFALTAYLVDGFDAQGAVTILLGSLLYGLAAAVIGAVIGANKKK